LKKAFPRVPRPQDDKACLFTVALMQELAPHNLHRPQALPLKSSDQLGGMPG